MVSYERGTPVGFEIHLPRTASRAPACVWGFTLIWFSLRFTSIWFDLLGFSLFGFGVCWGLGLGFGVGGLEFGVWGLGLRVEVEQSLLRV